MATNPLDDWIGGGGGGGSGPAVFAAAGRDATFDAAEMQAGAMASGLRVRLNVPDDTSGLYHIAFAVRTDLEPGPGLSQIEEVGSVVNARGSFNPPVNADRPQLTIGDGTYSLYVTRDAWYGDGIGLRDWSLR